ncbi:hypothetical protein SAMN05192588_0373 [Nonlabens sp. Hel1_33_55]|uniref:hypothetical protein n=1 Tax=Nonlabens sp. Hel1_33_55 TaxID=1336802 RepID=UPI000875BBC9|nr:hypothetical protein [Nonlabens sp. Hel1_33_55]SCX94470.1 hypothetical protein SAMN05192588_0373 [Nonlabens sp. Hel1_33_55]
MIDIFVFLVVLLLGINAHKVLIKDATYQDIKIAKWLWIYHVSFGVIYWAYIRFGPGGDAFGYYNTGSVIDIGQALQAFYVHGPGTFGMHILNVLPAKLMGFFGLSMIYTLIGYFAFLLYYDFFKNRIPFNSKLMGYNLFPLILFLPNLHFWSAGLGKDTILFFCIALFVHAMQDPKRYFVRIIFSLALSYLIRPHITIFLIISYGVAFILDGRLKAYQKVFLFSIALIGFILLFDNILTYLKIEELNLETVDQYSDARLENTSRSSTGSGLDVSSYPLPLKIFTFLYRPLFFDINNALAVVASFENLILLVLTLKYLASKPFRAFKKGSYHIKALLIFLVLGAVSFSFILGNLGIMLRQKNMFMPALIFTVMWAISYQFQFSKAIRSS